MREVLIGLLVMGLLLLFALYLYEPALVEFWFRRLVYE
jgi:hypothetical protein